MTAVEYQRFQLGLCRRPNCQGSRLPNGEFCALCEHEAQKIAERMRHGVQGQ